MNTENKVCIHIEYYLAIKKNEILSFTGKEMELEMIMLSQISLAFFMLNDISQTYKNKHHLLTFICWKQKI
jgi:hypothetical protein